MIIELLEAFIEPIGRSEKRQRVGYVNRYRDIQLATGIPHGIESGVINLYQCARGNIFAEIKAESFENLQAPCALMLSLFDGVSLNLRVFGFLPAFVAGLGEAVKAFREGSIVFADDV